MRRARLIRATVPLVSFAVFVGLGGCSWSSSGPDQGDAGAPQREECTGRVSGCRNRCAEADLGLGCSLCCENQGLKCDMGIKYSFNDCLDK